MDVLRRRGSNGVFSILPPQRPRHGTRQITDAGPGLFSGKWGPGGKSGRLQLTDFRPGESKQKRPVLAWICEVKGLLSLPCYSMGPDILGGFLMDSFSARFESQSIPTQLSKCEGAQLHKSFIGKAIGVFPDNNQIVQPYLPCIRWITFWIFKPGPFTVLFD